MRALVDTHALLWWFGGEHDLSETAQGALTSATNSIFVSSASVWELAIKNKSGKLDAQALLDHFEEIMEKQGFESLPITANHALRAGALPLHHSDPFDRMLVAQAQAERLAIISLDRAFDHYGIRRIW